MTKLKNLKPTKITTPNRYLIYGVEGVGKSCLAAESPGVIFLDVEGGTENLEVTRYPLPPKPSFSDVREAIADLADAEHAFETVAIDTVDALEALLHEHLCAIHSGRKTASNPKSNDLKSIGDFGYGEGYKLAVTDWRLFLHELNRLRDRGMRIILLGHSHIRPHRDPKLDDYDRHTLRMHKDSGGLLKEWCDVVGFMQFEQSTMKGDSRGRTRGISTGVRTLSLQRDAGWDAKCRIQGATTEPIVCPPGESWAKLSEQTEPQEKKK